MGQGNEREGAVYTGPREGVSGDRHVPYAVARATHAGASEQDSPVRGAIQ
jgi:hypothetical protein